MVEFIENTITYYSNRIENFSSEDVANKILEEIEKRGMSFCEFDEEYGLIGVGFDFEEEE